MRKYKLIHAADIETDEKKQDEIYTNRIGCTVEILALIKDTSCILKYITDNKGNPKEGLLTTSIVQEIAKSDNDAIIIFTTCNTRYTLKEV